MSMASTLIAYRYDALDRMIGMTRTNEPALSRFFRNGSVAAQVQGERHDSFLREGTRVIAYSQGRAGKLESTLLGTDQNASVLQSSGPEGRRDFAYTPYGHRAQDGGLQSLLGFNAEQADPVTGCYFLGNGYRAYNPVLMRFHSPDSLSPFDVGNINPYTYCLGDPINRYDPTGHFSWLSILGIVIAVASIAVTVATLGLTTPVTGPAAVGGVSLSTAAAVIDIAANVVGIAATITTEVAPESRAGSILGYVSIGLGVAAFGTRQLANSPTVAAKLGGGATANGLKRQGAITSAQGARNSFAQSAGASAGSRNTVVVTERLQLAEQTLNYIDYSATGAEVINDYIIPYFSQSDEPAAEDVPQRQDRQQGLLAAADGNAAGFLNESLERMEAIRQRP